MKRAILIALLAVGVSTAAMAQSQPTLISGWPDGSYVLSIKDGVASVAVAPVIRPDTPNPTPVTPPAPAPSPQPPAPAELTPNAKAIKAAAERVTGDANRGQTAATLAGMYREVAKRIDQRELTDQETIAQVCRMGADLLLSRLDVNKAAWQPVRDVLGQQWTALAQSAGSSGEFAELLRECATGLEASTDQYGAIDWKLIIQIITMILEMLLNQAAGGVALP